MHTLASTRGKKVNLTVDYSPIKISSRKNLTAICFILGSAAPLWGGKTGECWFCVTELTKPEKRETQRGLCSREQMENEKIVDTKWLELIFHAKWHRKQSQRNQCWPGGIVMLGFSTNSYGKEGHWKICLARQTGAVIIYVCVCVSVRLAYVHD